MMKLWENIDMKLDDNNITKVILKDKSVHYIVKLTKDELILLQELVKSYNGDYY